MFFISYDFFDSSSKLLTPEGQVLVTLCKGQGGTPADRPMRAWHDSWQVVSMAANASLVLKAIRPFSVEDYNTYSSTGFRYYLIVMLSISFCILCLRIVLSSLFYYFLQFMSNDTMYVQTFILFYFSFS